MDTILVGLSQPVRKNASNLATKLSRNRRFPFLNTKELGDIITFVNKLDREVREPFELLAEIEDVLKINCAPVTWPLGMGKAFRGVYHLLQQQVLTFAPGEERRSSGEIIKGLDNPELDKRFPMEIGQLREDVELIDGASPPFDLDAFLAGQQSPVFFGSGINNFGVQEILQSLIDWAPPPQARVAGTGGEGTRMVQPAEPGFTGFVFKIQANMDPKHRDRIAFFRSARVVTVPA